MGTCKTCGKKCDKEYCFHHILPKSKYPEASLDEENIILLTWEEHDQVEMDMYRYEDINNRREQLKPVSYTHLTLPTKRIV